MRRRGRAAAVVADVHVVRVAAVAVRVAELVVASGAAAGGLAVAARLAVVCAVAAVVVVGSEAPKA